MRSPPVSPSRPQVDGSIDLQGSSRVTGGILRGRAHGNVFNNADADYMAGYGHGLECRMGRVQVYTMHADPSIVKPDMELKHEVTPKLTKVLKVLARKYSPVRSMVSSFSIGRSLSLILLDENQRVFLYENSVWNVKGRYETAMEDDDDALWTYHDGEDILQILVVSIFLGNLIPVCN
jgi:hypothetical protein